MGTAAIDLLLRPVGVIFFQRYKAKQAEEIEPPAVQPPPLPTEEAGPTNTIQPIHIDDAQYLQLTRALRPKAEPVPRSVPADAPAPNAPAVPGGAGQSPPVDIDLASPEQPSGTPIV